MKSHFVTITLLSLCFFLSVGAASAFRQDGVREVGESATPSTLPLVFIENRGQVDSTVRFLIRGSRGTVFFTKQSAVFDIREEMRNVQTDTLPRRRGVVVRMNFVAADSSCRIEGMGELPGKFNILLGNDESRWRRGIPAYERIAYRDLWAGIDLIFTCEGNSLRYEIAVEAGGHTEDILFQYDGAENVGVTDAGALRIETALGAILEERPVVYQVDGERKIEIEGRYVVYEKGKVGFEVERIYPELPLVIRQGEMQQ
jgi:hypothetical protein